MTHAESQDLLLDFAFGELDAARAAELQSHLAGCEECTREKAALDEARTVSAPLRALEEPSAGFDDRILAAAKAQAQLTHQGNIGQVIEVSGSVKPLGLTPSNIDAHGPVSVRAPERRRPRWMLRAALGGSVAAAAALALVVSTSLQTRQAEQAAQMAAKQQSFEIHLRAADDLAAKSKDEAKAEPQQPAFAQQQPAPAGSPQNAPASPPPPAASPEKIAAKKAKPLGLLGGSGGDAKEYALPADFGAGASSGAALSEVGGAGKRRVSVSAQPEPAPTPAPPTVGEERAARQQPSSVAAEAAQNVLAQRDAAPSKMAPASRAVGTAVAAMPAAPKSARADAQDPDSLEQRAQEARHAGNYALAAGLYRRAAALHREAAAPNPSAGAWDLAHAVECLASAGQFADARQVRDELVKLYPSEDTAFYAASRALREVEPAPPALDSSKR